MEKLIDPLLLALLVATDRRKYTLEITEPSLTSSQNLLISDRYVYSSLAYFYARELFVESVVKLIYSNYILSSFIAHYYTGMVAEKGWFKLKIRRKTLFY
ncbi:hypothetical protein [Bartonella sp. OT172YNZD]|uniref:hypothetical protein n=1 Tax=Bartonella sp. OT172YNZD TaxID=3243572 RepID=UPI0035CEE485